MIKLDFHGSLHGHFLEYVANVWIMQTQPVEGSLFKDSGVAHEKDVGYRAARMIHCGHWSRYEPDGFTDSDQVIRICLDVEDADRFFIATTNLIYRAGERGWDEQMSNIPQSIRNDPVAYRNNWYSKFNEKELYMNEYTGFVQIPNTVFEFDFAAFFSYNHFCRELNRLAFWLGQTFFPDQQLNELWQEFIARNQGFQSWQHCEQIIQGCLSNQDIAIQATVIEQAWINWQLARITRMYKGSIFDSGEYPGNCRQVYQEIQNHLELLRNQQ